MPMYDRQTLNRKAQALGFNRDAYEKMSRLTDILQYIGTESELSRFLSLKGGTAINLTVFNLPRLSVDIDLDFAENLSREETREQRTRITELLGRYLPTEGYALRDKSKNTHALDSFVYSYVNAAGNADNIKIEINYSLRCHALPTAETAVRVENAFLPFTVRTLAPIEIFASKIVALSSRAAARDLYDLNNMLYYRLFDESELPLLRKCAILYRAIAGDTKTQGFSFSKLNQITAQSIKRDLFPMIRHEERFDFATAKEHVSAFLGTLMQLPETERNFLTRFAAGHYEPQLLFDDAEILERIESHPMAAWRIQQLERKRDDER
jgi:predicted nucleotidyltransferase component of viral defense system